MAPHSEHDPSTRPASPLALGVEAIRRRPGLAWLIYGLNLLVALIISIPLLVVLERAVSESGYSEELATTFDPALWADIFTRSPDLMATLLAQLFWVVPVYLVWNVLSLTGLVHACPAAPRAPSGRASADTAGGRSCSAVCSWE
jgi:hypothetical protein